MLKPPQNKQRENNGRTMGLWHEKTPFGGCSHRNAGAPLLRTALASARRRCWLHGPSPQAQVGPSMPVLGLTAALTFRVKGSSSHFRCAWARLNPCANVVLTWPHLKSVANSSVRREGWSITPMTGGAEPQQPRDGLQPEGEGRGGLWRLSGQGDCHPLLEWLCC